MFDRHQVSEKNFTQFLSKIRTFVANRKTDYIMKKLVAFFISLACVAGIAACEKMWNFQYVDSYILTYCNLDNFDGFRITQERTDDSLYLEIKTTGMDYSEALNSGRILSEAMDAGSEKWTVYDSLRKHYGDVGYPVKFKVPPYVGYMHNRSFSPEAFDGYIDGVDITIAGSSEYPPGTSLKDRAVIEIASHYPFISSGYDERYKVCEEKASDRTGYEFARYSLKMPLSEADKDDFLLLDRFHMFRLSLPSDVAESGSVLTVSFVTGNGKAFSEEITVE